MLISSKNIFLGNLLIGNKRAAFVLILSLSVSMLTFLYAYCTFVFDL